METIADRIEQIDRMREHNRLWLDEMIAKKRDHGYRFTEQLIAKQRLLAELEEGLVSMRLDAAKAS